MQITVNNNIKCHNFSINSRRALTEFPGSLAFCFYITGKSKKMIRIWPVDHFPPRRSQNNVCTAAVIFQIIGKIEKGAKNEGVDREQGGKEECKLHREG